MGVPVSSLLSSSPSSGVLITCKGMLAPVLTSSCNLIDSIAVQVTLGFVLRRHNLHTLLALAARCLLRMS